MAAPIVIELVANPPPSAELVDALLSSCSGAVRADGCVLGSERNPRRARARVVVTLDGEVARFRVEELETSVTAGPSTRELAFRDEDPLPERFRAAGLVVASLVVDLEQAPTRTTAARPAPTAPAAGPPERAPPASAPAPEVDRGPLDENASPSSPWPRSGVALSASGWLGWSDARPWWGAGLDASFPLRPSRAFAACSAVYQQTASASLAGISEQRAALGLGAGLETPVVPGHLELRARLELALQSIRASIVQPGTGLTDSGGRFLVGLDSNVGLVVPLGTATALVASGELAWLGDSTTVDVRGKPAATIPPWMYGISLGIELSVP